MKNILDLKKEKVRVKVVFKKPSLQSEIVKVLTAIMVVSLITLGVSKATEIIYTNEFESASEHFSFLGVVSEISKNELILKIDDSEELKNLDIKNLAFIQSSTYASLVITDINPEDKIIIQGLTNGKKYFATRIISFSVDQTKLLEEEEESESESENQIDEEGDEGEIENETEESNVEEENLDESENTATTTPELVEEDETEEVELETESEQEVEESAENIEETDEE
jgi:hypothetical protein